MKQLLIAAVSLFLIQSAAVAQTDVVPAKKKKDWSKVSLGQRANDHFMIQAGYDGWSNTPDSIKTKGFGRHLNVYLMLDFPFKTDPRISIGMGVGVGSSNIYFDKVEPQVAGRSSNFIFKNVADTNQFKKYKLNETWLEAPLELRFSSNPLTPNATWKFALGMKLGTLIKAQTRGKDLRDKNGNTINSYVVKESSKRYFNSTRFAATARIGYGPFGLYGAYQLSKLIKDGLGPDVRPYSIGLVISGL